MKKKTILKRAKKCEKTYSKYFYTLFKMLNWIFGQTFFGYLFPHIILMEANKNGVCSKLGK